MEKGTTGQWSLARLKKVYAYLVNSENSKSNYSFICSQAIINNDRIEAYVTSLGILYSQVNRNSKHCEVSDWSYYNLCNGYYWFNGYRQLYLRLHTLCSHLGYIPRGDSYA